MNNEIRVHCHTSWDKYQLVKWPNTLQVLPNVGDLIESEDGMHILKVAQLVHRSHYVKIELIPQLRK